MSWFRKKNQRIESVPAEERRVKTEGVFEKCPGCDAALYKAELEASHHVCPHCGHHFRIGARQRLALLYDEGKYEELDAEVISTDPLEFVDTKPYRDRLEQARRKTGLPEAVINARGRLGGHRNAAGCTFNGTWAEAEREVVGQLVYAVEHRGENGTGPLALPQQQEIVPAPGARR